VIDRNFVTDYDSTSRPDVFGAPIQQKMLNEVRYLYKWHLFIEPIMNSLNKKRVLKRNFYIRLFLLDGMGEVNVQVQFSK
jgi:hypothetical protein